MCCDGLASHILVNHHSYAVDMGVVQDRSVLRDCQVGADFTVPENADYRGEVLAKGKRPDLGRQSSTGLG